jgi:hypothetical protein
VDLTGNINVIDNVTGTIPVSINGIGTSSSLIRTGIYTITPQDIDAGSVTSSASAAGSFNNQPVISSQNIVTVSYMQPTNDRDHNGAPDNGGYGGAVVPVPMMFSTVQCMAVNPMGMVVNLLAQ